MKLSNNFAAVRGRPVAVSVYRVISRMECRPELSLPGHSPRS